MDIVHPCAVVTSLLSVPDLNMPRAVHHDLQRRVPLTLVLALVEIAVFSFPIKKRNKTKNQPPDSEKQVLVTTSLQPEKNPP